MFLKMKSFLFLRKKYLNECSVLPFRVWSHMWCCCRSQYDPDICQFCTKLQIKGRNVHRFISKKLFIDSRKLFPDDLFFTVTYNSEIPLFARVNFGPDRQRPYSEHTFGTLHYEVISSAFMIFKFYLDIVGRIILHQCDKYLLPALFENENRGQCRNTTVCLPQNCFPMKKHKIRQNVFIFAVKLIKG